MPKPSSWYPVFLDVTGRLAVIVGAGPVAARKAESLAACGARVVVLAPEAGDGVRAMADSGSLEWRAKRFEESDLEGAVLAIAATGDAAVNAAISSACRELRVLVNVVDDLELCDFIVPAVVESGSIQIAVSTGGRSPALARRLRQALRPVVGPEYGEMNDLLGALREPAIASLPDDAARKRFFDSLLEAGVLELLRDGKREEARAKVTLLAGSAGVPLPAGLFRR